MLCFNVKIATFSVVPFVDRANMMNVEVRVWRRIGLDFGSGLSKEN